MHFKCHMIHKNIKFYLSNLSVAFEQLVFSSSLAWQLQNNLLLISSWIFHWKQHSMSLNHSKFTTRTNRIHRFGKCCGDFQFENGKNLRMIWNSCHSMTCVTSNCSHFSKFYVRIQIYTSRTRTRNVSDTMHSWSKDDWTIWIHFTTNCKVNMHTKFYSKYHRQRQQRYVSVALALATEHHT